MGGIIGNDHNKSSLLQKDSHRSGMGKLFEHNYMIIKECVVLKFELSKKPWTERPGECLYRPNHDNFETRTCTA